jgi:hypothetical protein
MADSRGHFVWYELMTTDMEAAKVFYATVVGWGTRDASTPNMAFTLLTVEDLAVSGLMNLPPEARKMGAEPRWLGYVGVNDVDAATDRITHLGGTVHVPPTDIPNISRFAVVADPQTATLALVEQQNSGEEQPAELSKPGRVGWHELFAADWKKAFAFYQAIFDWQKAAADTGQAGTYQLFSAAGETIGGMFTKPSMVPIPFWLYYFNVSDIDAATERVKSGGGQILEGPIEVPGGRRVARCKDPQGAMFALTEKRSGQAVGYFGRAGRDNSQT